MPTPSVAPTASSWSASLPRRPLAKFARTIARAILPGSTRYASAISVLCEPDRFGGDYDHLQTVALSTHVPVLCKEFIVDPIQVYAARYYGADAILLMMSIVDDDTYGELKALADELCLDVLTEAITEDEVDRAVKFGVDIIGINNRNLHDLSIDLGRTERLARHVPDGKVIVSESGIRDNATVRRLGAHAHAFLVGSQLTSQEDIDRAARDLVYGANKVCGLTTASSAQAARAAGARYGDSSSRRIRPAVFHVKPHKALSTRNQSWST